jgi:hypothetical protein
MSEPRREETRRSYKTIKTARGVVTFIHLILMGRLNQEGGDLGDGNIYKKLRSESLERNHLREFQMAQYKSLRIREVLKGFIYVRKLLSGRLVENDNKSLIFTKPENLLTRHATANVLRTTLHKKGQSHKLSLLNSFIILCNPSR